MSGKQLHQQHAKQNSGSGSATEPPPTKLMKINTTTSSSFTPTRATAAVPTTRSRSASVPVSISTAAAAITAPAPASAPRPSTRVDTTTTNSPRIGSSSSSSGPLTRKRAATSINTEEANHPRIDRLTLNTPNTPSSPFGGGGGPGGGSGRDLVCLCTPAPKIPRPRNSFILYRQHHQAAVVAANPGVSNPQISKIIGDQWKSEPPEVLEQWKRLSEEEKLKHQREHPGYKYQPNRKGGGGKGSGGETPTSNPQTPLSGAFPAGGFGGDPGRCPKCHGRYIAAPRTPSTPLASTAAAARLPGGTPGMAPPPPQTPGKQQGGNGGAGAGYGHSSRQPSGLSSYQQQNQYGAVDSRNIRSWPPHCYQQPYGSNLYEIREDYESSTPVAASPSEAKRRRYNSDYQHSNQFRDALPSPPIGYHQQQTVQQRYSRGVQHLSSGGRDSALATSGFGLPTRGGGTGGDTPYAGPSPMMTRPSPNMGPPPPPGPRASANTTAAAAEYHHPVSFSCPSEFDESLRLPPLQTHLPLAGGPSQAVVVGGRGGSSSTSPIDLTTATSTNPMMTSSGGLNISYGSTTALTPTTQQTTVTAISRPTQQQYPQTAAQGSSNSVGGGSATSAAAAVAKSSLEAMIMSIPYINKIRVLERISPPLPPAPGSVSGTITAGSSDHTRGPVIAIEGPNPRLMRQVAGAVEKALAALGECEVRTWSPSSSFLPSSSSWNFGDSTNTATASSSAIGGDDVAMIDVSSGGGRTPTAAAAVGGASRAASISSSAGGNGREHAFGAYLQQMMEWHVKSAEMVRFVTGQQQQQCGPGAPASARMSISGNSTTASLTTLASSTSSLSSASAQEGNGKGTGGNGGDDAVPPGGRRLLPVALLPAGYSLMLSDRFACSVPITDAYAPVDHWQWMATLWRGIVGPDLVVYVRDEATEDDESETGVAGARQQLQSVEFKGPGLMVVGLSEAAGGLLEKTERRLGFEVMEWVRGGQFTRGGGERSA
ncbi:hypothetical protein B0H66DRAFT_605667 [Apodospora peruviana]|uniref:HMG box domain-containing protein n=1 Tax=Apodospora peruviana TaxID=516989 RepID=A0AAE0HXG6_9PEZI|nr:hypothetical protein B0H66DRAFT_605667 [Apodospora peruviana]